MASYRELFGLDYDEITQRARDQQISGRGTMSKVQKIAALADEDLSGLVEVLDQKKSVLVEVAKDMGLDTSGTKDNLQIRIAQARLGTVRRDTFPDSALDGDNRKPAADLESSFETSEERREAIIKGTAKAVATAWERRTSYLLLESLLPRDRKEPLSLQPAYIQHHPDKIPVVELMVPQARSEGTGSSLADERVVRKAEEAAKIALQDGVSHVVAYHDADDELTVQPAHRQRRKESIVMMEVVIPHMAFRVHAAERNPLRLWKNEGSS